MAGGRGAYREACFRATRDERFGMTAGERVACQGGRGRRVGEQVHLSADNDLAACRLKADAVAFAAGQQAGEAGPARAGLSRIIRDDIDGRKAGDAVSVFYKLVLPDD